MRRSRLRLEELEKFNPYPFAIPDWVRKCRSRQELLNAIDELKTPTNDAITWLEQWDWDEYRRVHGSTYLPKSKEGNMTKEEEAKAVEQFMASNKAKVTADGVKVFEKKRRRSRISLDDVESGVGQKEPEKTKKATKKVKKAAKKPVEKTKKVAEKVEEKADTDSNFKSDKKSGLRTLLKKVKTIADMLKLHKKSAHVFEVKGGELYGYSDAHKVKNVIENMKPVKKVKTVEELAKYSKKENRQFFVFVEDDLYGYDHDRLTDNVHTVKEGKTTKKFVRVAVVGVTVRKRGAEVIYRSNTNSATVEVK